MKLRSGVAQWAAGLLLLVTASFWSAPGNVRALHGEDEILIGIEPEHNIFDQVERYRMLADYLSDQLGLHVRMTIMSRYGEVLKRFTSRKLDGAFLSSYTATLGIREMGLQPMASLVNQEGRSTSRGYIFVRRDSGIENAADMRQRTMAFVDPATTEGYLYPLAYLRTNGIRDDAQSFFGRHYFTGGHASAVFAVLDGRADIGSARDTVYNRLVEEDPSIGRELLVLGESVPVPEVTLCVRTDMDREVREKLFTILLHMEKTSRGKKVLKQFGALRFVRTGPEDFKGVEQTARTAEEKITDH